VTGFAEILQGVVERVPGALSAIFVDWEGEPVGLFAPEIPPLDVQIIGAQWGVVWMQLKEMCVRLRVGLPVELELDGERGHVLIHQVTDSYYVVLSMRRGTHRATAQRELRRTAASLRAEM
jgi:hypothetical protein